ncbi:MAG: YdbH domain-containing protein [Alphaproteobacteria bacterium]
MADRQILHRRRRRIGRWVALGLAVVLALAWFNAPWIVERMMLAGLARAGLEASLDVRRVGFFETVVDRLRIATPPAVAAEKVTIRYTPLAALRGDFYAAILDGLTIEGRLADAALAAARLEAALDRYRSIRVQHIEFAEAKAQLDLGGTPWSLSLRGMLALAKPGGFSGPISVVATSPGGAFGGEVRLAPDGDGRTAARLDVREAVLRLPGITLEQLSGHVGIGHGPGPLPAIDVDLSMSGLRPDKSGIERARLRMVADGPAAIASLAGIDLAGRRFTAEAAFDVAAASDGIQLRLSRPGSLSLLDVPRRDRMPLGLEARLLPGDAPAVRIEEADGGLRLVHAIRLATRMTTIATPLGGLRLEPAEVAIDGQVDAAGARGAATARGLTGHLADWEVVVEDARLVARWDEGPLRAELTVPRLVSTADPPLFAPLGGSLAATGADGGLRFEGALADRSGRLAIDLGGIQRPDGAGEVRLAVKPVRLGRDGADFAVLSPALGARLSEVSGEIRADGTIAWRDGRYDSRGRLLLRGLAATTPVGRARGINGVVALDRLSPMSTAGPQTLSVAAFDVGVPLAGGQVSLAIDRGRPSLTDVRFGLFGGAITLAGPARIDLAAASADIPLAARGVDLAAAARGLGIDGLAIEGAVDGSIPLKVANGRPTVAGADFRARAPGRLSYRPDGTSSDALDRLGPDLRTMLAAQAEFRFDDLRLAIAAGPDGKPRLQVAMRGARAGGDAGAPAEFRVDLDGRGDRPPDPAADDHRVPEAIERLMRAFD